MGDLLAQDLMPVQSGLQPKPVTIASAATVAPTGFLSFISGTEQITTITAPISGVHMLVFIFTNANPGGVGTGGNILAALDPAQNQPMFLIYDPIAAQYRASVTALS